MTTDHPGRSAEARRLVAERGFIGAVATLDPRSPDDCLFVFELARVADEVGGRPTSGDADKQLLDWLRELADEIVMGDDSLSDTDLRTWPSTVEFVDRHISESDRPRLELAKQELRRLGDLL